MPGAEVQPDTVILELYQRVNLTPEHGFALTFDKAVHRRVGVNWGYASIDPAYGVLNSDRFQIGDRAFAMIVYNITPEFLASAFITRAERPRRAKLRSKRAQRAASVSSAVSATCAHSSK